MQSPPSLPSPGDLTHASPEQAQQYAEEAARLGSFTRLLDLHWDAAAEQFRDWGNHTQDVALHWQVHKLPNGRVVSRELVRVVQGRAPEAQFVPHFGCAQLPDLHALAWERSHGVGHQCMRLCRALLLSWAVPCCRAGGSGCCWEMLGIMLAAALVHPCLQGLCWQELVSMQGCIESATATHHHSHCMWPPALLRLPGLSARLSQTALSDGVLSLSRARRRC